MRSLMRAMLFLISLLFTSCSTLAQMNETLDKASVVIESNYEAMKESGVVIQESTHEVRTYMRYVLPAVIISIFIFQYIFFCRILRKIKESLMYSKRYNNK